jgi:glyoxylase-like metal-dependent hydrolase (beta-lactamase superfamily II)
MTFNEPDASPWEGFDLRRGGRGVRSSPERHASRKESDAMTNLAMWRVLAMVGLVSLPVRGEPLLPQEAQPYGADLLVRVRAAAMTIPGALPSRINYVKLAESHRPLADIIDGGSQDDYVSARTAFQVVYPTGTVMIDSGMDQTVHRFYGFGREEPYWPERNAAVQQALKQAKLIVVTHEHGDHVAGMIRSESRREIAAKTLLTREQVRTLILYPQMPEIRLTPEAARDYLVVDYESYLPVAPGMVLIKAPGHTPGHQMVYVGLDSGREYLFIGDVAWTLANVTQLVLRPAVTMRRINEDASALGHQLRWIKQVRDQEKLIVIPSHDDVLLQDLGAKQLVGEQLMLR